MRDRFCDDGVVYWPRALRSESLQLAQEAYQWSLDHPGPGAGNIPSNSSGIFYQDLANPDAFSFYKTLIKHPDIIAIIRKLFASKHAWFMYEQVFRKQDGDTRRTPWHQDTPYLPVRGNDLAVLWISFDSLDKERSLEFVRKSHRGTLYDGSAFDPNDDTRGLYNNPAYPLLPDIESRRGDFDITTFPVEPGDVIIFHPSTLHGGGPTRENETRRTLSLRFFGDDAVVASRPGAKRTGENSHPLNQISVEPDGSPFRQEGFPQIY